MSTASVFGAELPKLPGGTSGIPREAVIASQRQRLIHGVTMAVAEKALAATTISDITERAGVSKKTFYEHFTDKLHCFLAAYDHGAAAILAEVTAATTARRGQDPVEQYRAGTHAYLSFLQRELPYARTFCLEMLAAGPEAAAHHRASRTAFADSVGVWHAGHLPRQPDWRPVSAFELEAATGLVYEIASARIAAGEADHLLDVCDDLIRCSLAVLGIPVR
ncbi:MAG: TetR/AcrR family transcriptional regulator [Streptomyces sp.]|uniref:TetR/AcrR family transcriptional regulator n=1 Tax=Streptomyces sp. TaxID=1931 RepID=UPI0025E047CD|nr:TetR/AcrR family transcriptional regulator [Streptomyces sp.]MBW8801846.1 TetR/AcrR family transcriptional regulator [Streptomyces sp.]